MFIFFVFISVVAGAGCDDDDGVDTVGPAQPRGLVRGVPASENRLYRAVFGRLRSVHYLQGLQKGLRATPAARSHHAAHDGAAPIFNQRGRDWL